MDVQLSPALLPLFDDVRYEFGKSHVVTELLRLVRRSRSEASNDLSAHVQSVHAARRVVRELVVKSGHEPLEWMPHEHEFQMVAIAESRQLKVAKRLEFTQRVVLVNQITRYRCEVVRGDEAREQEHQPLQIGADHLLHIDL